MTFHNLSPNFLEFLGEATQIASLYIDGLFPPAGFALGLAGSGIRAISGEKGSIEGEIAQDALAITATGRGNVGPIAGGGAKVENLSPGDIARISGQFRGQVINCIIMNLC